MLLLDQRTLQIKYRVPATEIYRLSLSPYMDDIAVVHVKAVSVANPLPHTFCRPAAWVLLYVRIAIVFIGLQYQSEWSPAIVRRRERVPVSGNLPFVLCCFQEFNCHHYNVKVWIFMWYFPSKYSLRWRAKRVTLSFKPATSSRSSPSCFWSCRMPLPNRPKCISVLSMLFGQDAPLVAIRVGPYCSFCHRQIRGQLRPADR